MHSKLDKVIVNKACGELSLLVKSTTCTFGPDQSCNFKQKSKFMKQNKTFLPLINLNKILLKIVLKSARNS